MQEKPNNDFKVIVIKESLPANFLEISDLIGSFSAKNSLIKRKPEDILRNYANHFVALDGDKIIGTIGFKVWPGRQPEIISFVVQDEYKGHGIGFNLVSVCIQKIKEKNFRTIWTLTTVPNTFKKFGFKEANIDFFPVKIWTDCKICSKNKQKLTVGRPDCDEIALYLILN